MVQAVTHLATPTDSWLRGLSSVFLRVALLEVEGPWARVKAAKGMRSRGPAVSLLDPSPLRWCLEAASPIVGWGGTPGAEGLIRALGLKQAPRAFVILPIVAHGKIRALAYADRLAEPLPMGAVAELFAQCERSLLGTAAKQQSSPAQDPKVSKRRRERGLRRPRLITSSHDGVNRDQEAADSAPIENAWVDALAESVASECIGGSILEDEQHDSVDPLDTLESPTEAPIEAPDEMVQLADDGDYDYAPVDEEDASELGEGFIEHHNQADDVSEAGPQLQLIEDAEPVSLAFHEGRPKDTAQRAMRRRWMKRSAVGGAFAAAACALLCLVPLAPPPQGFDGTTVLRIPPQTSVSDMAAMLEDNGLIRNAGAFVWLARATGADRRLRAGSYRLSGSGWAWTLLDELKRGQVQNVTITIPEGLGLKDISDLLSQAGIADADAFKAAVTSPDLLARYGIPGDTAEGYLFPETYTFAQGLSPRAIAEIMVEQFYAQLTSLPAAAQLTNKELYERIILASIVQREFKHPDEIRTIAGVFDNRLKRAMRLESCATVQYILDKPKQRLMLSDLRIESPFNTYLNPGLPPAPIGNPSLAAISAALHPEQHEYLFFVAREDGSDRHIFNETFAAHQESQKRVRIEAAKRVSSTEATEATATVAQAPAGG